MWRLIARPLYRCAIRSARGCVLPSPDGRTHAEEAAELLRRPDFFSPAVEPPKIEITGTTAFAFPSVVRTEAENNNVVRGHLEPAGKNWREKPSVILLHGWNSELQYRWQFPFWAQLLARAGLNAIRFELPYHASRRPCPSSHFSNGSTNSMLSPRSSAPEKSTATADAGSSVYSAF